MNKKEFLRQLEEGLNGLPKNDIEERLTFYNEIIEDKIEEGISEEEAVAQIGSVDEIVLQTIEDTPLAKLVKEKVKPKRRLKAWEIVFLILGSPIWLSLLVAVFALIIALYAVLWALIISLWAVEGSLMACAFGGIAGGIILAFTDRLVPGLGLIGAGFVSGGLAIFLFYGCKGATKGIAILTKKIAIGIKNCFIKKEAKK